MNQDLIRKGNRRTRIFVVIMGILTGLGGSIHGIFEILQGNKPTGGFLLNSIGSFTLIPNFLYTGIAATIAGLSIIIWTIGYIHKKNGPVVFLMLSILLFLTGGGFAHIIGFILTWALATRINRPLSWWRKVLPVNTRNALAKLWLASLIGGFLLFSIGIGTWLIFTPPGIVYKVSIAHYICWSFLILGLLTFILTIISGFSSDIETREN